MLALKTAVMCVDNHPVYVMLCRVVKLPIRTCTKLIEKFKFIPYTRKFLQNINFIEFTVTEATTKI